MTNEKHEKLVWAVKNGDLDEVKKIISKENIDINLEIEGRRLVHYSADFGHVEILSYLIENGAELNVTDKYGITPLLASIFENHTDVVRLLISSGAKKDGLTPDKKSYIDVAEKPEIKSLLL